MERVPVVASAGIDLRRAAVHLMRSTIVKDRRPRRHGNVAVFRIPKVCRRGTRKSWQGVSCAYGLGRSDTIVSSICDGQRQK